MSLILKFSSNNSISENLLVHSPKILRMLLNSSFVSNSIPNLTNWIKLLFIKISFDFSAIKLVNNCTILSLDKSFNISFCQTSISTMLDVNGSLSKSNCDQLIKLNLLR